MALLQNPPISIALPPVGIQTAGESISEIAETVDDYTSGKVVEDYVSDNFIAPLKEGVLKIALIYLGGFFIGIGLILLAVNSTIGKKAVKVASAGVIE